MVRFQLNIVAAFMVLASLSARYRKKVNASSAANGNVNMIPCPALSAMFSSGNLRVNSFGQISKDNLVAGIRSATGASKEVAALLGNAAGYEQSDIHQTKKLDNSPNQLFLNLMALKEIDQCPPSRPQANTPGGYPCSSTTFLGQHGFSTLLRHGQKDKGFWKFVVQPGALQNLPGGVGKGLTHQGLAKLLKYIRYNNGDYSGYLSLTPDGSFKGSMMQRTASHLSSKAVYMPMSEWQELLAWGMLMSAFSKNYGGTQAIHEKDLRNLIVSGKFPNGYKPKFWGIRGTFQHAAKLHKLGGADAFAAVAAATVDKLGNSPEMHYLGAFVNWQQTTFKR